MVSKKSDSMRLKTQRMAAAMPSLLKAPKLNWPTRLKSGAAKILWGMTAVPGPNEVLVVGVVQDDGEDRREEDAQQDGGRAICAPA